MPRFIVDIETLQANVALHAWLSEANGTLCVVSDRKLAKVFTNEQAAYDSAKIYALATTAIAWHIVPA